MKWYLSIMKSFILALLLAFGLWIMLTEFELLTVNEKLSIFR
jgi:hypothetical protein